MKTEEIRKNLASLGKMRQNSAKIRQNTTKYGKIQQNMAKYGKSGEIRENPTDPENPVKTEEIRK